MVLKVILLQAPLTLATNLIGSLVWLPERGPMTHCTVLVHVALMNCFYMEVNVKIA